MRESDWFAVLSGIIFLGAGSVMAALGERVMKIGGVSLIAVGIGDLIFWFGYYRNADAQNPIINNAPSINTFNQSGGSNTINVGPQRLPFDQNICDQLAVKLPSGKPIMVQSVGSHADQVVADQYQECLARKGFQIQRAIIGMMAPPPDHKFTLGDPNAPQMIVIMAPSAD